MFNFHVQFVEEKNYTILSLLKALPVLLIYVEKSNCLKK